MDKSFIIVVLLFVLFYHSTNTESPELNPTEILEKANIIDKAQEIFKSIKESDLYKTAEGISKWALPLLEAFGCVAKILMSQFASDSKELTYMKEQFKIINEKMDYVDQQFEEVKRLMDWNVIKIQYSKYERNSNLLQHQIEVIADAPPSIRYVLIDKFLLSYDQMYENAAENIYEGFVNQHKVFSENLVIAIRKFTKDHRFQIEKFFMGNLHMIMKCLEVETFYLNLKNHTSVEKIWRVQWKDRLNSMTSLMKSVAEKVTENWLQQSNMDIEEFNVENSQLSHNDYANLLYKNLNDKFRNRIWLVLVYDPLDKGTDHAVKICNGISQMQLRGHNILVSSLPLDAGSLDRNYYMNICARIPKYIGSWGHGPAHYVLMHYLEPRMNCNTNQIGAVIRSKSVKVILAPAQHVATCQWNGYYNRFVDIHKTLDFVILG